MDAISRLIARINTQLSDLTASQRLAIGLCAVIVGGSFLWLARWSVEPEYVRLFEEPMTREELVEARKSLPPDKFRIAGEYILVSPNDRHELFWELQTKGVAPTDTTVTFAKLIDDDSPFRPESENNFRRRVALQNELSQVIASSGMVRTAEVFITDTEKRRISARNITPTASVKVEMAPGKSLTQEMVNACAALVAGAVPGLQVHNISVVDGKTLVAHQVPTPEDSFAQGVLRERLKYEELYHDKILSQLSYMPGVRVAVTVDLDAARKQTREFEYTKPAIEEETTLTTESNSGSTSGESGVGPNVGQALAAGGGSGSDTKEETTSRFQKQKLSKETTVRNAHFAMRRAAASIGIPRSYLIGVIKASQAGDKEPDDTEIEARLVTERERVRQIVGNIIMAQSAEDVAVTYFHDVDQYLTVGPDGTLTVAAGASVGGGTMSTLTEYGPQGALALMALTGMLMMVRLAKKSAKVAAQSYNMHGESAPEEEIDDGPITVAAGPIGRVDPSEQSMLEGREVDEHSLRSDQIARQVAMLVDEDPSSVAKLIRRWTDVTD